MIPVWFCKYDLYEYVNCYYDKKSDSIITKVDDPSFLPYFVTDFMIPPFATIWWSHFECETNGGISVYYRTSKDSEWIPINKEMIIEEMCMNRVSNKYVDVKYPIKKCYKLMKEQYHNRHVNENDEDFNINYCERIEDNRIYFNQKRFPITEDTTFVCYYTPDYYMCHLDNTNMLVQFKIVILPNETSTDNLIGWDTGPESPGYWDNNTYFDGGYNATDNIFIKNMCIMCEDDTIIHADEMLTNIYGWY